MPDTSVPYWSQPSDRILSDLNSQVDGLSSSDAPRRLASDGPNALETREKITPGKVFLNQFNSPII